MRIIVDWIEVGVAIRMGKSNVFYHHHSRFSYETKRKFISVRRPLFCKVVWCEKDLKSFINSVNEVSAKGSEVNCAKKYELKSKFEK